MNFKSGSPRSESCSSRCLLLLRKKEDRRGCWNWPSSLDTYGYGKTTNSKLVHRLSYEVFKGQIPKNKCVLHSCDNPSCYNPHHLFLGTHSENMKDNAIKGKWKKVAGLKVLKRRFLTIYEVFQIKKMLKQKMACRLIAEHFGTCHATISAIKRRKTWKHLNH